MRMYDELPLVLILNKGDNLMQDYCRTHSLLISRAVQGCRVELLPEFLAESLARVKTTESLMTLHLQVTVALFPL